MTDVKFWEESYEKALGQLTTCLDTVGKGGSGREESIKEASKIVSRIDNMRRSYGLEIKLMRDAVQKARYSGDKDRKDKEFAALKQTLEEAKTTTSDRSELFVGLTGRGGSPKEEPQKASAEEKLDEAGRVQDDIENKFKNIVSHAQAANEVGDEALAGMVANREKIESANQGVRNIEGQMQRADKLIMVFSKRMMTDKFIQCFGCINVVLVVAIIIWAVLNNVSLGGDGNETPPDPAASSSSARVATP